MSMVLGQRTIYGLDAASRGRLNALYMTSIFLGGAIGSAIASSIYEQGGWPLVIKIGSAIPLLALIGFVINDRRKNTA
jgi:cyanate permease